MMPLGTLSDHHHLVYRVCGSVKGVDKTFALFVRPEDAVEYAKGLGLGEVRVINDQLRSIHWKAGETLSR